MIDIILTVQVYSYPSGLKTGNITKLILFNITDASEELFWIICVSKKLKHKTVVKLIWKAVICVVVYKAKEDRLLNISILKRIVTTQGFPT